MEISKEDFKTKYEKYSNNLKNINSDAIEDGIEKWGVF